MRLSIISLKGIQYDGEAVSVNVKTSSGEITVLDHHHPLVTELVPGKAVIIKKDGERTDFNVMSGFMEVGADGHVSIIAN